MAQTVARALALLEFLAEGPRSLVDAAEHLGVHKTTALRLLQTLESDGYARRTPEGLYMVGFRVVSLSQQVLDQIDLRTIAHPHLEALARDVGHTVHLAELAGTDVVYVDKIDGSGPMRLRSRIGQSAVLHTTGVAKAILAYLEPGLRDQLLATVSYERFTPNTITSAERFQDELDRTAQRGWAEDDAEGESFVNCVALPIFGPTGTVWASLSVTSIAAVAPLPQLRRDLDSFREVADVVSRELGWRPTRPVY